MTKSLEEVWLRAWEAAPAYGDLGGYRRIEYADHCVDAFKKRFPDKFPNAVTDVTLVLEDTAGNKLASITPDHAICSGDTVVMTLGVTNA